MKNVTIMLKNLLISSTLALITFCYINEQKVN